MRSPENPLDILSCSQNELLEIKNPSKNFFAKIKGYVAFSQMKLLIVELYIKTRGPVSGVVIKGNT